MNLTFALYLTDVLSAIDAIFGFIFVFALITFIGLFIAFIATRGDYRKDEDDLPVIIFKKIYSKLWVVILCFIPLVIIPTKTTMYLMLGSSYLSQSNIPNKVSEALNLKLNNIIDDLKKKDKKAND
jgi:hypothetical protein